MAHTFTPSSAGVLIPPRLALYPHAPFRPHQLAIFPLAGRLLWPLPRMSGDQHERQSRGRRRRTRRRQVRATWLHRRRGLGPTMTTSSSSSSSGTTAKEVILNGTKPLCSPSLRMHASSSLSSRRVMVAWKTTTWVTQRSH